MTLHLPQPLGVFSLPAKILAKYHKVLEEDAQILSRLCITNIGVE